MRSLLASALLTSIALLVLPAIPQRAEAGTGVLRCRTVDGTSIYTNKACGSLGAKSAPLPAEVLGRIAREQRRESRAIAQQRLLAGLDPMDEAAADLDGLLDAYAPARRPLASGCATTPQQLAMDLRGAVALGDVNRVAESFDWAGMDNAHAQRVMARLEQIARRPVRGAEYFDADIGSGTVFADAGDATNDGTAGVLQVTFDAGNGDSVIDYDVRRHRGCYLLRY